jgi:hypothetical protein
MQEVRTIVGSMVVRQAWGAGSVRDWDGMERAMAIVNMRRWAVRGWGAGAFAVSVTAGLSIAQPANDSPPTSTADAAQADAKVLGQPDRRYIRTIEDEDGNRVVMQAAARTFVHKGKDGRQIGPAVTMCAAVHIADKDFYEKLQSLLDAKDAVLFESVKPAGMGRPEHDLAGVDVDERKVERTESRIRMLGIAARAQKNKTGAYPESVDALIAGLPVKLKPYLASVVDDAWGRRVEYVRTVEAGESGKVEGTSDKPADVAAKKKPVVRDSIEITSLGADGKVGGEGANADLNLSDQSPIRSAEVPKGDTKGLQSDLADAFGLVFQLDAMTHEHANWRNSDLSVDQVQERLAGGSDGVTERRSDGEGKVEGTQTADRGSMGAGEQGSKGDGATGDDETAAPKKKRGGADSEALFKMLDGSSLQAGLIRVVLGLVKWIPGMQEMGKVALMETLGKADDLLGTVPGMERMLEVIIKDRNQVVIGDLSRIIETEPNVKTVGIIYGGGHMPDLEKHLAEMGYVESGVQWLDAISMDLPKDAAGKKQMERIREMVSKSIDEQVRALKKAKKKSAED